MAAAQDNVILELAGVTKCYDNQADVLKGVSLVLHEGESVAIVGPSGSGKSTLLNIAGALDRATAGQVRLDGQDLSTLKPAALAALRGRRIGFVFQLHHLLAQCTVLENVLVPTLAQGAGAGQEVQDRACRLLERVGLGDKLDRRPAQLSGGERQRVAVVRALINRPALLLADEPTGSLDHHAAVALGQLLAELHTEQGLAMIVVTHSLELAGTMGRVLELRDGVLM